MSNNQLSNYLAKQGACCPVCQSTDIAGQSVEINAGEAFQQVSCHTCDAQWCDIYTLTGIAPETFTLDTQDTPMPLLLTAEKARLLDELLSYADDHLSYMFEMETEDETRAQFEQEQAGLREIHAALGDLLSSHPVSDAA